MQFLNPGMLITLGLIPILILIHTLKPKPKQVEVSNFFLWQAVLKERSRNLSFERLQRNLPLILQIALVILAALALANLGVALAYAALGHVAAQHGWLPFALGASAALPLLLTGVAKSYFGASAKKGRWGRTK